MGGRILTWSAHQRNPIELVAPILGLVVLAACSGSGNAKTLSPFPDQPERKFVFQRSWTQIPGTIWLFEPSGEYVDHGGAVGLIDSSFTSAVMIEGVGINLRDASDVRKTNAEEIRAFMLAAESFCLSTGKTRQTVGANIFAKDGNLFLEKFCG
ncbi:MAG: hypothetical protein AAFQ64_06530 [Pseudomonadota bacterium]